METQQIEYKALWKDDYLKWICGFANAQGGILSVVGENHESDTNVVDNVTMNVVDKLSERQKDILKYIQHCDIDDVTMIVTMNATTMAQHFNVSRRTIMRDIDFLVSKGLIKRVGSKMKGHWEVISK